MGLNHKDNKLNREKGFVVPPAKPGTPKDPAIKGPGSLIGQLLARAYYNKKR